MATGSESSSAESREREREDGSLGFDPRPWPLVVGMLGALVAVFFALRPPASGPEKGNGSGTGTTRMTRTTRAAGAAPAGAAKVVVPALADSKETIEQGVTLRFGQGGKTDLRSARIM